MNDKTIRFIDSDYRELFRIPDGGSINIIYPPGDGRGIITRKCEYLDEVHTRIGNDDYHICEFAERMEAIGARYEPEMQLRNTELIPFMAGEEKFYTYNREEGNTCVGHIAGDFGNGGDRFHSSWADRENGRNTPEFQVELHSAVYAIRQGLLADYDSMLSHCQSHPEAMLDSGDGYKRYGFKLETDTRQYFTQCFIGEYMRDSRFIVYAYDKTTPVLEQAPPAIGEIQPGTSDDSKMFYRNDDVGSLCVGYLRGDHGKNGGEFHHNWFDNDSGRKTPEFQSEFQNVVNVLRQDVLKDYKSSSAYCYMHPEAKLPDGDGRYGFKLETESRQYYVRCTTLHDDYFYVFAYDKAAPVREQETIPENIQGYTVKRYVVFDNDLGFALAHNPKAVQPFVTWQLTEENGSRDYYWGRYVLKEETALRDFAARASQYKADYGVREKYNYLAAAEISKEQNYNMIDGLHNNEASPKPDLTDGQTHEEIRELAPETLPDEKASVMDQIREAREASKPPYKAKSPEQGKNNGDLEL